MAFRVKTPPSGPLRLPWAPFTSTTTTRTPLVAFRFTPSYPWLKTGRGRKRPARSSDWPCDLFMVIAKATRTGNWRRRSVKGKRESEGWMVMRGMVALRPMYSPVMTTPSRM